MTTAEPRCPSVCPWRTADTAGSLANEQAEIDFHAGGEQAGEGLRRQSEAASPPMLESTSVLALRGTSACRVLKSRGVIGDRRLTSHRLRPTAKEMIRVSQT